MATTTNLALLSLTVKARPMIAIDKLIPVLCAGRMANARPMEGLGLYFCADVMKDESPCDFQQFIYLKASDSSDVQRVNEEMNMRQLEMCSGACIVNDRCPRGLSYDMLKEQVPASYMLATYSAQFGGTPSACDCDRSDLMIGATGAATMLCTSLCCLASPAE
uniref:Uncharacterized protein n=1 Tax=Macrostomum lignano TaxID=282301 RepID=A0A1I8FJV9_9PLAT